MANVWVYTQREVTSGRESDRQAREAQEGWGVAYVADSGKALALDALFLCKNCDAIEDQVRWPARMCVCPLTRRR